MNGILPLWKPKGLTSHDCVFQIRKLFGMRKVGHTGTLDPEVEGVLVICLGEATKLVPFLMDTNKIYEATVHLGIATETEDQVGEPIEEKSFRGTLEKNEILRVLQGFEGDIIQIPPMYSAVKVNGKRLYEYARNNEEVERPERKVTIHKLQFLSFDSEHPERFSIYVDCSKGTYIRTLCVDIGRALDYPSHMSSLKRLATSNFSQDECYTFEQLNELKDKGQLESSLSPLKKGIVHLPAYDVTADVKQKIQYGQKIKNTFSDQQDKLIALTYGDQLLAIYEPVDKSETVLKPVRVFNV